MRIVPYFGLLCGEPSGLLTRPLMDRSGVLADWGPLHYTEGALRTSSSVDVACQAQGKLLILF